MNLHEEVSALAKIMSDNGLTRLEAMDGQARIFLEKMPSGGYAVRTPIAADADAQTVQAASEAPASSAAGNYTEVKCPIVGVFYAAPAPDKLPFVKIGQKVKKGDCLCIIEAMKQMNEIIAETDGEIADICVRNGEIAAYGQVLFKIKEKD